MKRFLTVGVLIAILFVFTTTLFISMRGVSNTIFEGEQKSLFLGSVVIDVAIADTPVTRRVGLSNLKRLGEDRGLFFVFNDSDTHGIWMKDMEFPIDIIWMDEDMRIVYIHRDVSPDSYPEAFHPDTPARFALEVNAGFSLKYNVKIGSIATFSTY